MVSLLLPWVPLAAEQTEVYQYDANGRLLAVWYSGTSNTWGAHFEYDAAGNVVTEHRYGVDGAAQDFDADTLPDWFELQHLNSLAYGPADDNDQDGLTNQDEWAAHGNPAVTDTDQDGMADYSEFIAGTRLDDGADRFLVAASHLALSDQVQIGWSVKAGRTYQVFKAAQLSQPWAEYGEPFVAGADGLHEVTVPRNASAFYRLQVQLTEP